MYLKKLADLLREEEDYLEITIEQNDNIYNVSMYSDTLLIIKNKDDESFWSKSYDEIEEDEELTDI